MYTFHALITNPCLLAPAVGWCCAQGLKILIDILINHRFNPERIMGAGGMPSSHSATVSALCTAAAVRYGLGSFEFAVTFFFAFIVMYDAMGVRRETGEQAKLLNQMVRQFSDLGRTFSNQEELKEFVGHTPLQVSMGALLGIAMGLTVCALLDV